MSWLTNQELKQAILRFGDANVCYAFQGVYPINQLPHVVEPPAFIIVNTDVHNLPGTHWMVLFVDKDLSGEVFDSLAYPLCNAVIRFMNRHTRHWTFNRLSYQYPLSPTCGVFVLYYVTQRLYYDSLKQFCNTLSTDMFVNERLMHKFYLSLQ